MKEKKLQMYNQLVVYKKTSSVIFELKKLFSFSKFEGFSGCFRLEAIFTKNSFKIISNHLLDRDNMFINFNA